MSDFIWTPSVDQIKKTNVAHFMHEQGITTANELLLKSTTGVEWFWDASVTTTQICWDEPFTQLMDDSEGFPFTKWFVGGRLNLAVNCLERHTKIYRQQMKTALVWHGECGARTEWTYGQLNKKSDELAQFLLTRGVGVGDTVALYMPMIPELVVAFFAILKLGAVVVPIFSGFASEATAVRLQDAKVKAVITADGSLRRGEKIEHKAELDKALITCPNVTTCVVVERLGLKKTPMLNGRDFYLPKTNSALQKSVSVASEHHALLIYTSGTTGKPKGTVHTHAGVLAQVSKEFYFHFDFKPQNTFFWVTDIGWMMGPWEIIGTLHFGGTLVLMEGAPNFPDAERLFRITKKEDVTHFGVSPTLMRLLRRDFGSNLPALNWPKLKYIGSTGEPWDEDSYLWTFNNIGAGKVPILNISGGTELMGCLLAPLPILPLKPCSLQGPALGMAVDIFNDLGVSAKPNEVGYLVCKKPAPSMTRGFLGDPKRYLDTYFSRFPSTWFHGDYAIRDQEGQWFLRGRADDTLKIAGKRTGPAEIESALCQHSQVLEACAFGIPDEIKGEALVCFVVLIKNTKSSKTLLEEIKNQVAETLGKTLKPRDVFVVEALPKTRSGKIVRGTIKNHFLRLATGDLASLENPQQLFVLPQV